MDKKVYLIGGGIVFIISIILFACSFDTVDPQNFGLKCSSLTKQCEMKTLYRGGRYFVYVSNYFIEFPAYQKTIEYSDGRERTAPPLQSRTADGFAVKLSVSF